MGQDLFAANGDKNSVGQVVIRLRLIDVGSTAVKISSFSHLLAQCFVQSKKVTFSKFDSNNI